MDFTKLETDRRFKMLYNVMEKNNLKAAVLIGDDSKVAPNLHHNLRYFVQNSTLESRQALLVFTDKEPILIAANYLQYASNINRSCIKNNIMEPDLPSKIVEIFNQKGISNCRVGFVANMMPVSWKLVFDDQLASIEWYDIDKDIINIHYEKSEEEIEKLRKSAFIADSAFMETYKKMKPGMTEFEVVAELEYQAAKLGASQHFSLIASGKFAKGDSNQFPRLFFHSKRKLNPGDIVLNEISPQYDGYWTQLVRAVSIGEPNKDAIEMHEVCVKAIEESLPYVKPNNTIKQIADVMSDYISACGYTLQHPMGHTAGVNLVEERLLPSNERVLKPGFILIIHPTIITNDSKTYFFWGQTFLVTDNGCESLNKTSHEFYVV